MTKIFPTALVCMMLTINAHASNATTYICEQSPGGCLITLMVMSGLSELSKEAQTGGTRVHFPVKPRIKPDGSRAHWLFRPPKPIKASGVYIHDIDLKVDRHANYSFSPKFFEGTSGHANWQATTFVSFTDLNGKAITGWLPIGREKFTRTEFKSTVNHTGSWNGKITRSQLERVLRGDVLLSFRMDTRRTDKSNKAVFR